MCVLLTNEWLYVFVHFVEWIALEVDYSDDVGVKNINCKTLLANGFYGSIKHVMYVLFSSTQENDVCLCVCICS